MVKNINFLFIFYILLTPIFTNSALAKNPVNYHNFSSFLKRDDCNNINWASWNSFTGMSAVGAINNGGDVVNVTMTSNFTFDSTPTIYNFSKFNTYPAVIPNAPVPRTTWSKGSGGTTTMCFSKTVTNPVLLIASLGSSAGIVAKLTFSKPYVVLFDGGNMVFNDSNSLTGTEGFAIIMFPGDFTCVTINSTTEEFYTNITWGIRPPPFAINFTEVKSCNATELTASGGVTYKWDGGDTPNSAKNKFHSSGTYLVTVTDANGCKTSASKEITVDNIISPTISGSASNCANVTLTASGGDSYQWNGGDTPSSATNTFHASGTYSVKVTSSAGCSATISKAVTILDPSTAIIETTFSPQTPICEGTRVSFTASDTNGGLTPTFDWYKNGALVASGKTYTTNALKNDDEIYCELTSSSSCAIPAKVKSGITKMVVNEMPTLKFEENYYVENGKPVQLNPIITGNIQSFTWVPSTGLNSSSIKNPFANPSIPITYTLKVTTISGCETEATVKVLLLRDIFIPNVFSPNGDAKNDGWLIRNIGDYPGTKVDIFNRYGIKIYHSDSYLEPWDGKYNNIPVPIGTYYYMLYLNSKTQAFYSGSVTILR